MKRIFCMLLLTWFVTVYAMASGNVISMRSAVLPAKPKRVVVLEFMLAESLATLDVTPVGMVDPARYREWIGYDLPRFTHVVNVGTRQQPSLEAIARLKPDLILGVSFRHAVLFDQLTRIAPTVLFEFNARDLQVNQLQHMLNVFSALATITGHDSIGQQVKHSLQNALAADRKRLADAGLSGKHIAILQELGLQDRYWAYTTNSMAGGVAQSLDISLWPNWPTREGTTFVTPEDLLKQTELSVLLISATGSGVGLAQKLTSPIWPFVPANKTGRIALMPRNIWGFGGPMSATQLSQHMTDGILAAYVNTNQIAATKSSKCK
jgi:ferric hydroxamate transport system substrate-binding protein